MDVGHLLSGRALVKAPASPNLSRAISCEGAEERVPGVSVVHSTTDAASRPLFRLLGYNLHRVSAGHYAWNWHRRWHR